MKTSWLVASDTVRASHGGLEVEIRLPWYRGLPLSTVEIGEVKIDGQTFDPEVMTLTVNGKERPAKDLSAFYEEYWYVLDSAYLRVPFPQARQGAEYQIEVTVILYPPYIPGIPFRTSHSQSMRAS